MRRCVTLVLAALAGCPVVAGCLHQASGRCDSSPAVAPGTPCAALPVTQRAPLDLATSTQAVTVLPVSGQGKRIYRALTPQQCQCLAVHNAELANLLDAEREGIAEQTGPATGLRAHTVRELSDFKQMVLFHTAQEIRNRNAGTALELYFHLAEAEAKADLVERSLEILRDVSEQLQDMKKKGLRVPMDYETLARQQLDAQIQQTQIQQVIDQLNGELIRLLGLHGCTPEERLWPAGDFSISGESIETESALALGLAQRPELILLREVEQRLDARTLSAVAQLAKTFHVLLGLMEQPPRFPVMAFFLRSLHGGKDSAIELDVRRQQLRQQLQEREAAVTQEIRQAARTLAAQQRVAALTQQKIHSWETGVRDLEDRQRQGLASVTEVALGKLDGLRARGDLAKEIMAWHIARAQLQQAQGGLLHECTDPPGLASPAACSTRPGS